MTGALSFHVGIPNFHKGLGGMFHKGTNQVDETWWDTSMRIIETLSFHTVYYTRNAKSLQFQLQLICFRGKFLNATTTM